MSLKNIHVGCTALGNELHIYRGKLGEAQERIEAEREIMAAVVEHMMADAPEGSSKDLRFGDRCFTLTVVPITVDEFEANREPVDAERGKG